MGEKEVRYDSRPVAGSGKVKAHGPGPVGCSHYGLEGLESEARGFLGQGFGLGRPGQERGGWQSYPDPLHPS